MKEGFGEMVEIFFSAKVYKKLFKVMNSEDKTLDVKG